MCKDYMPQCELSEDVRLFLAETGAEISINPANSQPETPEFKKAWSFLEEKMQEAALKKERCSQLGSTQQPEPTVVHVQVSAYTDVHIVTGRINHATHWSRLDFIMLPEKFHDNFCVVSASIKRDGQTYCWLNERLRNNRRLALFAAKTDAENLWRIPDHFLTDPEIVLAAMEHGLHGKSVHEMLKWLSPDRQQKVKDILSTAGLLETVDK